MLAVISDLHLQHTERDVLRVGPSAPDGAVAELGVRRNVTAGALALLFDEIRANALRHESKHIHLVLGGDIFELYRTPLWFEGEGALRPYHAPDASLEKKTLEVLEAIARENSEFFEALQSFGRKREYSFRGANLTLPEAAEVSIHFIPGNHDRLANLWPSVRGRVRDLLGMSPSTDPFPHWLDDSSFQGESYRLRIRHGHEYDPGNFAGVVALRPPPTDPRPYDLPCLGDYVTVDICARLPLAFRARYAPALRAAGPVGDIYRRMYQALMEFDDVRPASKLGEYLASVIADPHGGADEKRFAMLTPILCDMDTTALSDPFFGCEMKRLGKAVVLNGVLNALAREAVHQMPQLTPQLVGKLTDLQASDPPASFAQEEAGVRSGEVELVIAGHTHRPDQVPLASARDADFVDSGTWRTVVVPGASKNYGRLRSYTMVFGYNLQERKAPGTDGRRFETWTGNLASGDIGPYQVQGQALGAPTHQLVFKSCQVTRIDEGDTRDGAELRLFFGVDHQGFMLSKDHVHNGDPLVLDASICTAAVFDEREERLVPGAGAPGTVGKDGCTARLYPALDGDVWAWGFEEDLGNSIIDRDDPLPWAITVARRENGSFAPGTGTLVLASRDGSARLDLGFEVR